MGRIGVVLEVRDNEYNGESIPELKIDLGGSDVRTAPLFSPPGNDSRPVAGDYVACVSHPGGDRVTAVAFASPDNPSVTTAGEYRVIARDTNGNVMATIYMQGDGTVKIENDGGYIELARNGQCSINGNLTVDA